MELLILELIRQLLKKQANIVEIDILDAIQEKQDELWICSDLESDSTSVDSTEYRIQRYSWKYCKIIFNL